MNPARQFLALTPERRALAFKQAAAQRAVDAVIIEKDFWVCWLLGMLFSPPALAPHLVFKGGTSLSKVFGVIDRFSEDVDLSVSPAFVGADAQAFDKLTSRTQRDAAVADMQRLCRVKVQNTVEPLLEAAIRTVLGTPTGGGSWLSYEVDTQFLFFHYPASQTTGFDYIRRDVKLELGSLTDQQPVGQHAVRPWLAEEFPTVFADWHCEVTALELARSFWEKATLLHAEYHRPADQPTPDRYARHYADVARLLEHPDAAVFMADKDLCTRVAEWKSRVFARSWAQYDLARHGGFRLAPPVHRKTALANDYAGMRPMFLHEPPPFAQVMEQLRTAEQAINSLGRP